MPEDTKNPDGEVEVNFFTVALSRKQVRTLDDRFRGLHQKFSALASADDSDATECLIAMADLLGAVVQASSELVKEAGSVKRLLHKLHMLVHADGSPCTELHGGPPNVGAPPEQLN